MIILAIETSCDETAIALLEISAKGLAAARLGEAQAKTSGSASGGKVQTFKVLANFVASQINIHKKYGGVVPEVAARKHMENILPLLDKALKQGKITPQKIDAIAVVYGPGLITSLIVGVETAKTLAMVWNKPLIPINHVKAHILANYIKGESGELEKIEYPALCLVVSGGHTSLVLLKDQNNFKTIGSTRDDAVGEAFDKTAKIMGLGYPGGPIISKHAENADNEYYKLPRPMIHSKDFDFSFSGLKTAVRNEWEKVDFKDDKAIRNMCAAFQQACIDVLVYKTLKAAEKYQVKSLLLGGGVSANRELRRQLEAATKAQLPSVKFFQPDLHLTTDNALMIAVAAYFEAEDDLAKFKDNWLKIRVDPNLEV